MKLDILNFGPRWRWVVSFTSWPLYFRGKSPRFPLDSRLGGPRAGLGAVANREKSLPAPAGDQIPCRPVRSPVITLTELLRLLLLLSSLSSSRMR